MTAITFIIVGMTTRGMCDFDIRSLERILTAAWAVADDRTSGLNRNARRTHGAADCWSIGIYTVQIVEVSVVPIGAGPIVSVERHG